MLQLRKEITPIGVHLKQVFGKERRKINMGFVEMRDKLIEHFNEMVTDVDHLFEVDLNKDLLWDLYLESFPAGTNDIYSRFC